MKTSLYSETRDAARIMTINPIVMNTQEKRRALTDVGREKTKDTQAQEAAVGSFMAQTKFRIWDSNPIGTDDGKEEVETDTLSFVAFRIAATLAAIFGAFFLFKLGKKILKKSKKGKK